jgi:hypothetical protein
MRLGIIGPSKEELRADPCFSLARVKDIAVTRLI